MSPPKPLLILLAALLPMSLAPESEAASTGYIQIECDSSAEVFLDGRKVGTTSADQSSLTIEVSVGRHTVEVRKSGFRTQAFSIEVEAARVKLLRVAAFRRSVRVGESGDPDEGRIDQEVGVLKLQTVPTACSIDIPQLGLSDQAKSKAEWYAKDIPVGTYSVSVTAIVPVKSPETGEVRRRPRTIRVRVPIVAGRESYLLVNVFNGEVRDVLAEERLSRAREQADRGRENDDWDAWRAALRFAQDSLEGCMFEPEGARALLEEARRVLETTRLTFRIVPATAKGKDMPLTWEWNFAGGRFLTVESTYRRETSYKLTVLVDGETVIHRRDISETNWADPIEVPGSLNTRQIKLRIEHFHDGHRVQNGKIVKSQRWLHSTARLEVGRVRRGRVVELSTTRFRVDLNEQGDPRTYWPGDRD